LRYFEEGMGARLRAGVEILRREHSWERLADETVELIQELKPGRGM